MNKLKPLVILLVEDNIDHAELMTDALQGFNINNTIRHVVDGERAIAYMRNDPPYEDNQEYPFPDIVLLDIRIPRQNGIATLSKIKHDKKLKHVPVIMVSTSKTASEIHQCYSLGASGYISKPLQYDEFARKIGGVNDYWVQTSELPANPESNEC